jgi:hypothetical protein
LYMGRVLETLATNEKSTLTALRASLYVWFSVLINIATFRHC